MSTAELHTLTGAYTLHALSAAERDEFERHLTQCSSCAQEVRELSATAARLGLALTEPPPPEMRERVLNRVATVRQESIASLPSMRVSTGLPSVEARQGLLRHPHQGEADHQGLG